MTPSLLHPAGHLSAVEALALSQQAPAVLKSLPSSGKTSGASTLQSLLFAPVEKAEVWITYENLLLSCLRTGDFESAQECVQRLTDRFGDDTDRVLALEGLIREAQATDDKGLQAVLKSYDDILATDDANVPIHKRRIALLRSMGKIPEAVTGLLALLDFSPTDAEAWSELADVYLEQGLYGQAVYALEEVLVLSPNAWNVHARLGEVEYMAAATSAGGSDAASQKYAAESLKRFCRSIELCDDYLRGYYGLKVVTSYILKSGGKWPKQTNTGEDFAVPETATVQRLAQLATEKLSVIVRRYTAKEPHWSGYDEAEIVAARELLSEETSSVVR
ncbi:tetratricopeptide repeat domain-containing protein [Ophiostoma piceae UAMH 11346]|uniref:ER membrane protein complex subunit 2 n=1 Tax=Ophiostoma piceae (strain UAMH 11346) TaxID=1262450 RepID=S3CBR4_OPHP1|nr:tetratricopeptide repeat domain-containing protein [Ophiostoma piceae UAMH 11346]